MDPYISIKRHGFFLALLTNADSLHEVCEEFLNLSPAPSIPGLCASLGTTPSYLKRLFADPDNPQHPENKNLKPPSKEVIHVLASTIMHIEARTVEQGLVGSYNAHMSKFILSAYHDKREKTETHNTTDKQVRIIVETHQPIDLLELKEMQRLEEVLADQEAIELQAMGKSLEGKRTTPRRNATIYSDQFEEDLLI